MKFVRKIPVFTCFIYLMLACETMKAQITVSSGSGLVVLQGTVIDLQTTSDSLVLEDSTFLINHGIINLSNGSLIKEAIGYPVQGSGWEQSTSINPVLTSHNSGNLGLSISSDSIVNQISVRRFHSDTLFQINGINSVKRFYQLLCNENLGDYSAEFRFDTSEQNNRIVADLKLIRLTPNGIFNLGGQSNPFLPSVLANSDSLGYFVAAESSVQLGTLSDTMLCVGETITINYQNSGIFNSGNQDFLFMTNGTDTVLVDTSINGTYTFIVSDTTGAGSYSLFSHSSSAVIFSGNQIPVTFSILSLPVLDTSSLQSSYCLNAGTQLLNITPMNGIFTGSGIQSGLFDPILAGVGTSSVIYAYTDTNGCSASMNFDIEVFSLPNSNLSSIAALCMSNDSLLLTQGSPSGGIYFGTGVSNSFFNPSLSGSGTHAVYYSVTDSNSCSDTASTTVTVNPLPVVTLTPLADVCLNAPAFTPANGSPSGGLYSGIGFTSSVFDPSQAGSGTFVVNYSYTDGNGCTDSTMDSITVAPSPTVPVVSENFDQLGTGSYSTYQWYLDGVLITGANNQTLVITQNGNYQVEVSNAEGCTEISSPYPYQSVSVDELSSEINLYPVPSYDRFVIESTNQSIRTIEIIDSKGATVFIESNLSRSTITIDITAFEKGIYFIRVGTDRGTITKHMIKA